MSSFLRRVCQLLCWMPTIAVFAWIFYVSFLHAGLPPTACSRLDFANRKWVEIECTGDGSGI
jgi:hypothetical protein